MSRDEFDSSDYDLDAFEGHFTEIEDHHECLVCQCYRTRTLASQLPVGPPKSFQLPGGKKGKAFTSTIGSSTDLLTEGTRRLIVNSVFWCLDLPVPEKAEVDLVGNYNPTAYAFRDDKYWVEKNMVISELQ